MFNLVNDDTKTVYGVEKVVRNEKKYLNWKSSGCTLFLILFGDNIEKINLKNDTSKRVREMLSDNCCLLFKNKTFNFKSEGIQCFIFSHSDLKRYGGMCIKDVPGIYAVYGIQNTEDESLSVYTDLSNKSTANFFTMTVDVIIEDNPVMIEKRGLFRKSAIYSGYRKISLKKPHAGLTGGVLKYSIDEYSYSFPDSVVEKGGSFFVKAPEDKIIHFKSDNSGIKIRS